MRFATTDAELKQTMERMEADQSSFSPALQDLGLKLEALKAADRNRYREPRRENLNGELTAQTRGT